MTKHLENTRDLVYEGRFGEALNLVDDLVGLEYVAAHKSSVCKEMSGSSWSSWSSMPDGWGRGQGFSSSTPQSPWSGQGGGSALRTGNYYYANHNSLNGHGGGDGSTFMSFRTEHDEGEGAAISEGAWEA